VHKVVELFLTQRCSPEDAVEAFGIKRDRRLLEWLAARHKDQWVAPEIKFAYDPFSDKARMLESKKERDYSEATDTEFVGTLDMMFFDEGRQYGPYVHVSDLKTGNPAYLEPCGQSGQMTTLGLMASRVFEQKQILVSYLLTKGGIRRTSPERLDATDMDLTRMSLAKAMTNRRTALPVLNKDCWKCPAKAACPAYKDATYD
jgi:hypothetical protein